MPRNRNLAAAFGVMCAVLFSMAYMTGYFTEYIPAKYHFPIWVLNVFELTILRPAEAFGPMLGLIFAALFAFFAFRAYFE
jgi:hypothetical protein